MILEETTGESAEGQSVDADSGLQHPGRSRGALQECGAGADEEAGGLGAGQFALGAESEVQGGFDSDEAVLVVLNGVGESLCIFSETV